MAIYHLSTQAISRGQGRSIVACAAYRAAEQLIDQRYGKTHDYRRKENVTYKEIFLPEGAPEWLKDREALWNYVEKTEKRKDARLAREVQFALPRELSFEQNKALAQEFVKEIFVKQGMIADLCLHLDKGADGEEQPHCHVLLTTRKVDKDGFKQKNPQWNKKELLLEWREAWANMANEHLAKHGYELKIDHRSYAEQQIALEPQRKIGSAQLRLREERIAEHEKIARENGERIYKEPQLVLDALTKQQATFCAKDLERFIKRHTKGIEQFAKVYEKVSLAEELILVGQDEWGRERYSTKEMVKLETEMLKPAQSLAKRGGHEVRQNEVRRTIEKRSLAEEQEAALEYLTAAGDLKCVLGYAGTGKSYLLDAAREGWGDAGYRVRGVALARIAAQNLEQSSGIKSRTIASMVHSWDKGREQLTAKDILVIDEAGMVGSRQLGRIMTEAQTKGAKVILVGDWQQLQAIEAGAAFRAIAEAHSYVELQKVRRQQSSWQRGATTLLAKGQVAAALTQYEERDHLHSFATQAEAKECLIKQWNDVRHTEPEQSQLIMAYTRKDVAELNNLARALKQQDGELGPSQNFVTSRGPRGFAAGDRIYFLKRDDSLGVINGTLGTIKSIADKTKELQVELDHNPLTGQTKQITVDVGLYEHLEHGYAATVHKAQGVTVDRAYLLISPHYDAHSTYVGLNRHRHSCDVYSSQELFRDKQELLACLSRNRLKDVTLDYAKQGTDYATRRAIEPNAQLDLVLALQQKFEQNAPTYEQQMKLILEAKYQEDKQQFWQQAAKFISKFERVRPGLAQQINASLVPDYEKQAVKYMEQFKEYGQNFKQLKTKDKQEFAKITKEVMSSKIVMNYITRQDKELAGEIKHIFKEQQHTRQYERSLSW